MRTIKNMPEAKQLIGDVMIEASIQAGIAIRKDCKFEIVHLLYLLYDKCTVPWDRHGILQFDETEIMASPQLGHYWCKMKAEMEAQNE